MMMMMTSHGSLALIRSMAGKVTVGLVALAMRHRLSGTPTYELNGVASRRVEARHARRRSRKSNKFVFDATRRHATASVWTLTIFNISLLWRGDARRRDEHLRAVWTTAPLTLHGDYSG